MYSVNLTYALASAGEEDWQPLLRPSFLESLWQKLAQLWQELGFTPDALSAASQSSLANYVQSGAYPTSQHPSSGKHHCTSCTLYPWCLLTDLPIELSVGVKYDVLACCLDVHLVVIAWRLIACMRSDFCMLTALECACNTAACARCFARVLDVLIGNLYDCSWRSTRECMDARDVWQLSVTK